MTIYPTLYPTHHAALLSVISAASDAPKVIGRAENFLNLEHANKDGLLCRHYPIPWLVGCEGRRLSDLEHRYFEWRA